MKDLKTISGELKIFGRLQGVSAFDSLTQDIHALHDQIGRTLGQKDKLTISDKQKAQKNLLNRAEAMKGKLVEIGNAALNEAEVIQSRVKFESEPKPQEMYLAPLLAGKSTDELMKMKGRSIQKLLLSDAGELLGLGDTHRSAIQKKLFPNETSQIESLNTIAKTSLKASESLGLSVSSDAARLNLTQDEQALIDSGTL